LKNCEPSFVVHGTTAVSNLTFRHYFAKEALTHTTLSHAPLCRAPRQGHGRAARHSVVHASGAEAIRERVCVTQAQNRQGLGDVPDLRRGPRAGVCRQQHAREEYAHFKEHGDGAAVCTVAHAEALLDAQCVPNSPKAIAHAEDAEDTPVVAAMHNTEPYTVVEVLYQTLNGEAVSDIVSATVVSPAQVPAMPLLAKLGGERLVAAPSYLPLVLAALQACAMFAAWFKHVCDVQLARPEAETRLYLDGGFTSMCRVIESFAAHQPDNAEAVECLRLFAPMSDERDAALRIDGIRAASQNALKYVGGTFTLEPQSYGFTTAVAREAEQVVFAALTQATGAPHRARLARVPRARADCAQGYSGSGHRRPRRRARGPARQV